MGVLAWEKFSGKTAHAELSHANLANDANLLIDTIHNAFVRCQEARVEAGNPLPEVLYLQLDNVGTNKSKLLLLYASWLVMIGAIKKVKVGFLLVGHTHENIDQLFSAISHFLRRHNCLTLEALKDAIRRSYTPAPTTAEITHTTDWEEFLFRPGPGGVPSSEPMHDISYQQQFKIEKNESGDVVIRCKQLVTDTAWGQECHILTSLPSQLQPPLALPLLPLQPIKLQALKNVCDVFKQYQPGYYTADVEPYWEAVLNEQERMCTTDYRPPPPPNRFKRPLPLAVSSGSHTSVHTTLSMEEIERFHPPRRDMYVGRARGEASRDARSWIQAAYEVVSFQDCFPGSMSIVRHPPVEWYQYIFRIKLNATHASEPLVFAEVIEQHVGTGGEPSSLTWVPYTPTFFTDRRARTITKAKASKGGCFVRPSGDEVEARSMKLPFVSTDCLISWDWDEDDTSKSVLPIDQYDESVKVLRALEVLVGQGSGLVN